MRVEWLPVVFPIVLLTLAAPRSALADARFDRISKTIQQLIETGELPSIVVSVAEDGRILWEAAYGWADREQQIRATPRTPYSLASISKPFTATAVMMLAERGQLALDRQANDYLDRGKIAGRDVRHATVRRLLAHTAGLPPYFRAFFASDAPAMDDLITRDAVLRSRPGRRHVYSNLGYGILEQIIARVSGTSYEEYLDREIFGPLGLENASVPRAALPGAATRYDARNQPLPFYDLGHRGASAIFASARDLIRFGMVHLKQRIDGVASILKSRTIDDMQRIQTPESRETGYGLGWRIDDGPGFRRVGHTGGMPGVTTVLMLFPSQRVAVVVLANKRSERVLEIADQVAGVVMPMYAWRLREPRTRD